MNPSIGMAKNPSQQHQSEAQGLGLSNSVYHVNTGKTDSVANPSGGNAVNSHDNEQTTNKTDLAGHVSSPIRQKADSSNGAESNPVMVGQGSQESADIVLGENANLEHYLGGIQEQDAEDSSPNPHRLPSAVNLDMDNFVLLSERQRAE